VCPLRALSRVLPDVLGARNRDGLATRSYLHHQVARRGADVAQRLDGAPPLAVPRLPRLRDGVSGRRAVRAAHRSRQGRDRARPSGHAGPPALPLAQLRALARAPAPARAGGVGRALLSGERTAASRQKNRSRPAPARDLAGLGSAAPTGAGEGRARGAAAVDAGRGPAPRAGRAADRLRSVRDLRRPQPRHRTRAREERLRGRGARGPGMLRRAQRSRRRPRARGGDGAADDRRVRGGARRRR